VQARGFLPQEPPAPEQMALERIAKILDDTVVCCEV
jgi:hypothetical protein